MLAAGAGRGGGGGRSEGAGRGEEEGEGRRPAVREPEGEGLAARVPDSPAASRPRPAAACPAAEEEEEREEEAPESWGWAAAGGADCGARGALFTPEARRCKRGAGGAGRRDCARGGGALSRAAPVGPLPPPSSAGACALRAPQPLMSCGARGAAGLGGVRPPTPTRTRAGENRFAVLLRGPQIGLSLAAPLRLSTPLYPSFEPRK
ncbi:hypothetical protein P7K49_031598 [Saguinus oedipus]|uniref:Uncharacterized protein n=1 Tax=Saguinus oedipus TaxID=9490 RepID=A0ABQ9TZW3_SAGOE|nr:hypothetical protein P7K49_031598 [Saguinus oedipus]